MAKIRELLPYVSSNQIVCMTGSMESLADVKVLVVSYNMMERNIDQILQRKFTFVILVI